MGVIDAGAVTLVSRNGANITRTFPEVSAALTRLPSSLVLDGEIVALNEDGVPCFSRLQRRWRQTGDQPPNYFGKYLSGSSCSTFSDSTA